MVPITQQTWEAIWFAFVATVIAYNVAAYLLVDRLKRAHPELHATLGNPSVFGSSLRTTIRLVGFMLRGGDAAADADSTLRRRVHLARALFGVSSAMFIFLLYVAKMTPD